MNPLLSIITVSWLAGAAAFLGGLIASLERSGESETKCRIIHGVIAFGGGTLLAAISFALLPESMTVLSPLSLAVSFSLGGALFCLLDALLSRHGGPKAQFMAMLMDFIPEAISLGAVFGHDRRLGLLLAAFIGAQNLPEGFNSFREMRASRIRSGTVLTMLLIVSLAGPAAACIGHFFLQERPQLTGAIMTFASGGILYLLFQDIAPQARMRRHWTPPLGAVLGFLVGMLGNVLIQ